MGSSSVVRMAQQLRLKERFFASLLPFLGYEKFIGPQSFLTVRGGKATNTGQRMYGIDIPTVFWRVALLRSPLLAHG